MLLSEYIQKLQKLLAAHGDLECEDSYGESIGEPELNTDGEPIYLLADKK